MITFASPASGAHYSGTQSYAITGTISPAPGVIDNVFLTVKNPSGVTVDAASVTATPSSGAFSYGTATGGNGNYGGPCPPAGDPPHHYIFTLYALNVPSVEAAAGIPATGTAGLHGFALGRGGLGPAVIGKATFTATYGR